MSRMQLPTCGSLVMWNLSDTKITPADLRRICADEGDAELAGTIGDIDPGAAVKRAAREWRPSRAGDAARFRAEVVGEPAGAITIGVLKRRHVRAGEVEWIQVASVDYDPAVGVWRNDTAVDGTAANQLAAFVECAEAATRYLDHAFIRPNVIQATLAKMAPAKARDRGAVYIPPGHDEALDRLARIVGKVGASSLDIYDIAPSGRSAAAAKGAVRSSLGEQIAECRAQLAEWRGKARKPRADAVENLINEFSSMRDRAALYADALQITLADIEADIDAARADAQALILGGV